MRFPRWIVKRDPLVVTLLPTATLRTPQEQQDENKELEWRKRVAENVLLKGDDRRRKVEKLRQKWAEKQALTYLRQAS